MLTYNQLNLPQAVDILSPVAEARNSYSYSANGVKLRVVQRYHSNFNTAPVIGSAINLSNLNKVKTNDYVGKVGKTSANFNIGKQALKLWGRSSSPNY